MKYHTLLFSIIASMTTCVVAAATNVWIGPSGGSWGKDENWSLEHVPTSDEIVDYQGSASVEIIVDGDYTCACWLVNTYDKNARITLKGAGSVTARGTQEHYNKKPLVLDGVTLALNGQSTLLYADLTLKNGAKLTSDGRTLNSWGNKPFVTVEDGEISCGVLSYASTPSRFWLKKGTIVCDRFIEGDRSHKGECQFTVDGGAFVCGGEFILTNKVTYTMNGGSLSVGGSIKLFGGDILLNLNDGVITNASMLTVAGKRLITESKGTAFVSTATGVAVDILEQLDETLTFKAPFSALNGSFLSRYRGTVVSDQPFAVQKFSYVNDATSGPLTVRIPQIVVSDSHLCEPQSKMRSFYLEGPLTLRPTVAEMSKKSGTTAYVYMNGTLTVDTRDWNDPSLKRSMAFRNLASKNGNASLVICGGGSFSMTHLEPMTTYRSVVVEEGTTLSIDPYVNLEFGPLCADKIVLGKNAVLKITGGTNNVNATKWEIDPTARIEIAVPAGFATGGRSFIRDFSGQLSVSASQVVLSGEGLTSDCRAVCSGGTISVVKPASSVDGSYAKEWVGNGTSTSWTDGGNWADKEPAEKGDFGAKTVYAFGCGDARTSSYCDLSGPYMGQIVFRDTAVSSFSLSSRNECNFSAITASGNEDACVYSLSAVQQNFGLRMRGPSKGYFKVYAKDGPVVLTCPEAHVNSSYGMRTVGDVRVAGNIVWSGLRMYGSTWPMVTHGQVSILSGGSLILTDQTDVLASGKGNEDCSFFVGEGGHLEFRGSNANAKYSWSARASKHVIDGLMTIGAPYYGGQNQVFGGKGVVSLASVVPNSASSTLTLADSVTLEVTNAWTTAVAGTDAVLSLKIAEARDTPTIRLQNDWTYGVPSGVTPTGEAADRALTIGKTSVLNVNANGYTATFTDPVSGAGTLAITNGSVCLAGDVSGLSVVRLDAGGCLNSAGGFGRLTSQGGMLLLDTPNDPLVCTQSADVTGLKLAFVGEVPMQWTVVLTAPEIEGTAAPSDKYRTRKVAVGGGYALQCKQIAGMILYVR